jgi:phosphoribosylformylglycinamidine cyclo-ligase
MEIYTTEDVAEDIVSIASSFGIDAQVIGKVVADSSKSLEIKTTEGSLIF